MKSWLKATAIRTIKTGAETMAGFIVVGAALNEVQWLYGLSVSAVAMVGAVLWAIKGLPEVSDGDSLFKIEESK